MRRAIARTLPLVLLALVLDAPAGSAKGAPIINAIGLIDYSTKPTFRVGDWVSYHVVGNNNEGDNTDYTLTVIIAGEERFWGEDCFWIETRTQAAGAEAPSTIATLMSYGIFSDTLATPRMKLFMRKSITDVDDQGVPRQDITKRPTASFKNRTPPSEKNVWNVDTLGTDTVQVPRGLFKCRMIRMEEGISKTTDYGDSSARMEVREARTDYHTLQVPITHITREKIETTIKRKTWLIGHSQDAQDMRLVALSTGDARLIDFGSGMKSGYIPKNLQRSLKEQDAATARASTPKKASKPATTAKKSG